MRGRFVKLPLRAGCRRGTAWVEPVVDCGLGDVGGDVVNTVTPLRDVSHPTLSGRRWVWVFVMGALQYNRAIYICIDNNRRRQCFEAHTSSGWR